MTLADETIATGAEPRCPDCQAMPKIAVHGSAAGFYAGTWYLAEAPPLRRAAPLAGR